MSSCAVELNLQQMFVMTPSGAVMTDESVCLDAPERDHTTRHPKVRIMACSGLGRQKWNYNERVSFLFAYNLQITQVYHTLNDCIHFQLICSCSNRNSFIFLIITGIIC